jgi:hypothetical protein
MEGFSVQTKLSNADWRAYTRAWTVRVSTRGSNRAARIGRLLIGFLLGAGVALAFLALGRAFPAVSARELAEQITPSKPQAFYGPAIAAELAKFEPVQPAAISRLNSAP